LVIGVPALAFALFGWSQAAPLPFGDAVRYVCVLGSLGAMICGALLLDESLIIRKAVVHPIRKAALEFLVMTEYEAEQEK
jgi:hypothetical protein